MAKNNSGGKDSFISTNIHYLLEVINLVAVTQKWEIGGFSSITNLINTKPLVIYSKPTSHCTNGKIILASYIQKLSRLM